MKRKDLINASLTAAGLATAAGLVLWASSASASAGDDAYDSLPETVTLTGIVRDFRERTVQNGHPDFERQPSGGFGHYTGNIEPLLDADGKPVFKGGGKKIKTEWRDANGNNIHPALYNASLGDRKGAYQSGTDDGAIQSQNTFRQWFRTIPGVNMAAPLDITLVRQPGTNLYTFDDKDDSNYQAAGGFFPINGQLFGNSQNGNKNFHFTFELATEFVYEEGSGQIFKFTGDDDVWVFIDGRNVIDIGGVHSAVSQTIDLDRLDWLEDGQKYKLHFFFAERHRTQSNFRIDTTLTLRNAELPRVTAMYD